MFQKQLRLIVSSLISFFFVFVSCVSAQVPLFPIPIKTNNNFEVPLGKTSNVLILENNRNGKKDTIGVGSFVKLWFETGQHLKIQQSILRTDFNRKKYEIESTIANITDSTLVLVRTPPTNPVPLPVPVPMSLFMKKDTLASPFITVNLSDIKSFTSYVESVQQGTQNAIMMPAMSFFPDYFTSWPEMLYAMPVNMIAMQLLGSSLFSTHRVNGERDKYRLYIYDTGIERITLKDEISKHEKGEWQVERISRLDNIYERTKEKWLGKVLFKYKGNKIISLSLGTMFIPGYEHAAFDSKTKVEIQNKKFVWGFSTEHFISERFRIGMEMQMHATEKSSYMTSTGTMSGGGGFIFSNFTYFKIGLGNGIFGNSYREKLQTRIQNSAPDKYDDFAVASFNAKKMGLLIEPKPYFLFGMGAVNTTLIRMHGNQSSLGTKEYEQKKLSIESGLGFLSRISKRFVYDMSLKYIWSPKYTPSIGSVNSYSGLKLQFNIGYMMGPGFKKMEKELKLIKSSY